MTETPSSISQAEIAPGPGEISRLTAAEVDRSCRLPVLALFGAAAVWLAIGALFGVISAIKAHGPGFLASPAWLTYGRVRPVAANALVYGFLLQAGLGVALWMFCRLGRNLLAGVRVITAAALFWNIGLLIGLTLLLAGESTGYEWLEIPRPASLILFGSYVLVGVWGLVNLHARREREMYVSQWFLLTGLLWFPWVYSTAQLLLLYYPVRGIMQAVVNGWYIHNLFELCLAPVGLATIFYFLPKFLGRPLHSRGLALFGFWLVVLFAGWGGVRPGQPTPNWLVSVTGVARIFALIGIAAFAVSWFRTVRNAPRSVASNLSFRFVFLAACSYLLVALLETAALLPPTSDLTAFTLFDQGVTQLRLHGFLLMAMAGGIYYIAPRVAAVEWPSARLAQVHFWCALGGTAFSVIGLLVGGLVQGAGMQNSEKDFLAVVRSTVPFLGANTLGATLLLVGYVAFANNLIRLVKSFCPCGAIWSGIRRWQTIPSEPRRAKA